MRIRLLLFTIAAVILASFAGLAHAQQLPENSDLRWRMIGPFRGGRTRAVAGVHGHPTVFYIGAVDEAVTKL